MGAARPGGALTLCAAAALAGPAGVAAQSLRIEPSVNSQLTWTSNSSLGEIGTGDSDVILEVTPMLRMNSRGGRVSLNGALSLDGVAYARRTQPNAVLPTGELNARVEAVERLLFIDAGYRASVANQNPFGANAATGSTTNRVTASQWHLSPSVEGNASPDVHYLLRSDNAWTRSIGASNGAAVAGADGYFGRHSFALTRVPQPVGWRLEAERSDTRYDDPAQSDVSDSLARAALDYTVIDDLEVGLRVGSERNRAVGIDSDRHTITGIETKWTPSPRTTLSAFREKRFFGNAWNLGFDYRWPRLAWNVGLSRGIDTTPQALFDLPPTDNLAATLDALLAARDPGQPADVRARQVRDLIASQGLPSSTQAPISLFTRRISIATVRQVGATLLGARSTLSASVYSNRFEDAIPDALVGGGAATNNKEIGASLVFSHRLSAFSALSVAADWRRIRALDPALKDKTAQRGLKVNLSSQAGPSTYVNLGARYRRIGSNVVTEGHEGAVYLGLDHRF